MRPQEEWCAGKMEESGVHAEKEGGDMGAVEAPPLRENSVDCEAPPLSGSAEGGVGF